MDCIAVRVTALLSSSSFADQSVLVSLNISLHHSHCLLAKHFQTSLHQGNVVEGHCDRTVICVLAGKEGLLFLSLYSLLMHQLLHL